MLVRTHGGVRVRLGESSPRCRCVVGTLPRKQNTMPKRSTEPKLSKANWLELSRRALGVISELEISVERRRPWLCSRCNATRGGVAGDGSPACTQCDEMRVVPGQRLDFSRGYLLATVQAPRIPRAALAVLAGSQLASPIAGRQFLLEAPAEDFLREMRVLGLPGLGLHVDGDGIWRHQDRSRADGSDAADVVFGLRGGVWTEEELRLLDE